MEKRPSACALLLFNYLYPDPLTPRIVAFFVSLVILSFSLAGGAGRKSSHLYNHILWASGSLIYRINGIHQFFSPAPFIHFHKYTRAMYGTFIGIDAVFSV